MAINLRRDRNAITLIELIVVITLSSVILLAAFSIMISQFQYISLFKTESDLKGEATYIIERLKQNIMNSEHVNIADNGTSLELWNRQGTQTGAFTISTATSSLIYTDVTIPSFPTETISNKIGSLVFDDAQNPGTGNMNINGIRVLKITLNTRDPAKLNVSGANIETAVACRLTANVLSVLNSTKGVRYFNIQSALNDNLVFQPGDEIRCMGRNPPGAGRNPPYFDGIFPENVGIPQSVILKGSYDNNFATQTFQGSNATPSTIDGQQLNSVISGWGGITLNIDRFIIQNGRTNGYGGGGGILISMVPLNSTPSFITIYNNIITANSSTHEGGGGVSVYQMGGGSNSVITLANNTISSNNCMSALEYAIGGGILVISYDSTTNIINNIITANALNNSATGSSGGGMLVSSWGPNNIGQINISNNIISGNNANMTSGVRGCYGGGMSIGSTNSIPFTVTNNLLQSNTLTTGGAEDAFGGGIRVAAAGGATNFIISGNTIGPANTAINGAGIYAEASDNCAINISTNDINNNPASQCGGGVYAQGSSNSNINMLNNIITNNSAPRGGGTYVLFPGGGGPLNCNVWITNNTIASNPSGSGIYADYSMFPINAFLNVMNTICWNNQPFNIDATGPSLAYFNVYFSDVSGNGYSTPTPYNGYTNVCLNNTDPLFAGGTPGYMLQASSQCVDAGYPLMMDTNLPPAQGGAQSDMGAYGGANGPIGFRGNAVNLTSGVSDVSSTRYREDIIGPYSDDTPGA